MCRSFRASDNSRQAVSSQIWMLRSKQRVCSTIDLIRCLATRQVCLFVFFTLNTWHKKNLRSRQIKTKTWVYSRRKGRPSKFVSSERESGTVRPWRLFFHDSFYQVDALLAPACTFFTGVINIHKNTGKFASKTDWRRARERERERGPRKMGRPPLHYSRQSSKGITREPAVATLYRQSGYNMQLKWDDYCSGDRVRPVLTRTRRGVVAVLQQRHRCRGGTATKRERVKLLFVGHCRSRLR